jgi:cytidyltransferase-like protein
MKRAMYIGRFQPFHLGHMWVFSQKLNEGIPILVAVRDVATDEKNPFTAQESADIIKKVYPGDDVSVIIIPDIESVNYGRGVGYQINEFVPPPDVSNISATQIRNQIAEGSDEWKKVVDPAAWQLIENKFSLPF